MAQLGQVGIIFNKNDIEGWSEDSANNNTINGITLKSDVKGHAIHQMESQPFNDTSVAFTEGSIVNTYTIVQKILLLVRSLNNNKKN